MKKFAFLALNLLLLIGCGKNYDLEERLTLDVQVVDENMLKLPNIDVDIYTDSYYFIFSEEKQQSLQAKTQPPDYDNDYISFNETDQNGEAQLIFPKGKNEYENDAYQVILGEKNESRKSLSIYLKYEDFQDFYLQILAQKLFSNSELVRLTISTELEDNFSLLEYELIGNIAYDFITAEEFLNPKKFHLEETIDVQKNQILQLNYTLLNQATEETTEATNQVEIINENMEYVIQNP